jgi:hypothetical protein
MKKKKSKKDQGTVGQITSEEALDRMKRFKERKEKFVAAVKKSKD